MDDNNQNPESSEGASTQEGSIFGDNAPLIEFDKGFGTPTPEGDD